MRGTRRLWVLGLLATLPALLVRVWAPGGMVTLGLDLALVGLVFWDYRRLPKPEALAWRRNHPRGSALGEPVEVSVTAPLTGPWWVQVVEAPHPRLGEVTTLGPRAPEAGWWAAGYRLLPSARGRLPWGPMHVGLRSPLGLIWREAVVNLDSRLIVFPPGARRGVGGPAHAAALSERHLGVRGGGGAGIGGDFLYLRELAPGEALAKMDWKATARIGRPVGRQHARAAAQNLLVVIDLGQAMGVGAAGDSPLDQATEAASRLVEAASREGDRVGLLILGQRVRHFHAPTLGRRALPAIRERLAGLMAEAGESRPQALVGHLERSRLQRALVVIFTESGVGSAGRWTAPISGLVGRHLVLICPLTQGATRPVPRVFEREAGAWLEEIPQGRASDEAQELARFRARGLEVVPLPSGRLVNPLIGRYLEMRRRL